MELSIRLAVFASLAIFVIAAVLVTLGPDAATAVVATRDLPAGTVLTAKDLREVEYPADEGGPDPISDEELVGRVLGEDRLAGDRIDRRALTTKASAKRGWATISLDAPDGTMGVSRGVSVAIVTFDASGESSIHGGFQVIRSEALDRPAGPITRLTLQAPVIEAALVAPFVKRGDYYLIASAEPVPSQPLTSRPAFGSAPTSEPREEAR